MGRPRKNPSITVNWEFTDSQGSADIHYEVNRFTYIH